VLPKQKRVTDFDSVEVFLGVVVSESFEHFDLDHGLLMESFAVADYFECTDVFALVVEYFDDLAETALAEWFEYFLALGHMVVFEQLLVAFVVVLAEVLLSVDVALNLPALVPQELDILVLHDFGLLLFSQEVGLRLDHLLGRQGEHYFLHLGLGALRAAVLDAVQGPVLREQFLLLCEVLFCELVIFVYGLGLLGVRGLLAPSNVFAFRRIGRPGFDDFDFVFV